MVLFTALVFFKALLFISWEREFNLKNQLTKKIKITILNIHEDFPALNWTDYLLLTPESWKFSARSSIVVFDQIPHKRD